jgi:hypothetical protein
MTSGPPRDAAQIRQRLATMPGLNGGWWFDEAPWFVPGVRAELLSAVNRGEMVVDGVDLRQLTSDMERGADMPAVYERLKRASEFLVKERFRGSERALLLGLFESDPDKLSDERFNKLLVETLSGIKDLPGSNPRLLHLQAVLHQYRAEFDLAEKEFLAAQNAYEKEGHKNSELYALLLSDYGRMLTDRGSMSSNGQLSSAAHESRHFDAPAFRVVLLGQQGESMERDGALDDAAALMQEAVLLAEHSLAQDHPLRAAAHERMGWVRLDQYRLADAKEEFKQAAALRERNLADTKNHRALRYVLHDRQGEYMCEFFLGRHKSAIADLRKLIAERFDKPLAGRELTPKERRELLERQPNTWERLGDCYLLGSRDFAAAAEVYESALDKARLGHWDNEYYLSDLIRLRYKHVIALAMIGGAQRERAAKLFAEAEPPSAKNLSEKLIRYFALAKAVAQARLQLEETSPQERLKGFAQLGSILTDPKDLQREPDAVNRDDLSLLLLAGHVFFESDTITVEMPDQRQERLSGVAAKLWELCYDRLRESDGDLDSFLRPYLSSMRAALEASLKETDNPALQDVLDKVDDVLNKLPAGKSADDEAASDKPPGATPPNE